MDKTILKNSAWLLLAQGLTKMISFFYTIFLARSLGVENFGYYIAAQSYFSLVSSLGDFGVARFLTREVVLDKKKLSQLLFSTIFFRFSLLVVFFLVFLIFLSFFDPDIHRKNLSLLAIFAVIPQSLSLVLDAVFIAFSKVALSAVSVLILSLVTTVSGISLVSLGFGPYGAVSALIVGQLLYAATLLALTLKQKLDWVGSVSSKVVVEVLKGSLPYGILGVLGLLYFKVDSLMLSYLKGSFDTGIYGAGYKFLEAIVFVPSALSTAVFPTLAKLHITSQDKLKKTYFKNLTFSALLSLPTFFLFYFILPVFLRFFLPSYQSSIQVIKILSFTIPFMFTHIVGATTILSTNKFLKDVLVLSVGTLSSNVVLNLVLIPRYSFYGSAWATVFSEALSFIVFFIFLQRRVFVK